MKKSYLILFLLASFFSVNTAFAQANVQSTGISIQGIARDENNSALSSMSALPLAFKIYYLNGSNAEVDILNQTANVTTDFFGVFSYVITIDKSLFNTISNTQAYLKVTSGSTVFSNEKLQAVPYAIHAQNGVPTGTIMAYIGSTAPEGWLLCDGTSFPDNATNAKLKALLGSTNTPDLRAMFLRGTGTGNGKTGPALKTVQQDDTKSHLHGVNLNTNNWGEHSHPQNVTVMGENGGTGTRADYNNDQMGLRIFSQGVDTEPAGAHSHTVIGNTASTGGTETRPINYGVNYIIKI